MNSAVFCLASIAKEMGHSICTQTLSSYFGIESGEPAPTYLILVAKTLHIEIRAFRVRVSEMKYLGPRLIQVEIGDCPRYCLVGTDRRSTRHALVNRSDEDPLLVLQCRPARDFRTLDIRGLQSWERPAKFRLFDINNKSTSVGDYCDPIILKCKKDRSPIVGFEVPSCETAQEFHNFSVRTICEIHRKLCPELIMMAGHFRTLQTQRAGQAFVPPEDIGFHLERLVRGYEMQARQLPRGQDRLLTNLARFYGEFIAIHPFINGNGRVGQFVAAALAWAEGVRLNMKMLHGAELALASHSAHRGDMRKIRALFKRLVVG